MSFNFPNAQKESAHLSILLRDSFLQEQPRNTLYVKTTKNGYLKIGAYDCWFELDTNKRKAILEKIGRAYFSSMSNFYKLYSIYIYKAYKEKNFKNFYLRLSAHVFEKTGDKFQGLIFPFIRDFFSKNQTSYMGQAKIAEIVAEYLGLDENLALKKDYVDLLFTDVDENTRHLDNAFDTFWALGCNFWRQIIDGKYHYLNDPLVFDLGLHTPSPPYKKEPGFYLSMYKGCRFASMHFNNLPSAALYKRLHGILCSHFPSDKDLQKKYKTLMSASESGKFRPDKDISCMGSIYNLYPLTKDQVFKNFSTDNLLRLFVDVAMLPYGGAAYEYLSDQSKKKYGSEENYQAELMWGKSLVKKIDEKIQEINIYIKKRSDKVGSSSPIATISKYQAKIKIAYHSEPLEIPYIIKNIFKEFESNITKVNTRDEKIKCIADLYQLLEWVHPFPDGQGRTDLVLLSALLSKYGINPPILLEPYASTFCTSEEWAEYLKNGIKLWQEKYLRLSKAASKS